MNFNQVKLAQIHETHCRAFVNFLQSFQMVFRDNEVIGLFFYGTKSNVNLLKNVYSLNFEFFTVKMDLSLPGAFWVGLMGCSATRSKG